MMFLLLLVTLGICSVSAADAEHASLRSSKDESLDDIDAWKENNKQDLSEQSYYYKSDPALTWPFHKKNHSASPPNNSSDSCSEQATCESCNDERLCHWCTFDNACHTVGSPHGCVYGSSCTPPPPPKNDTCLTHTNCVDCSLSSRLCHWCAHDNACHPVGSVYGCVTGVDCYDNAHCQRAVPEAIAAPAPLWCGIGLIPLVVIVAVSACSLCCTTTCCCVMSGVKGAYDDLTDLATVNDDNEEEEEVLVQPLLMVQEQHHAPDPPSQEAEPETPSAHQQQAEGEIEQENEEMRHVLQDEGSDAAPEDYVRMEDGGAEAVTERHNNLSHVHGEEHPVQSVTSTAAPRHHRRRVGRSMQRLYNTCAFCYLLSLVVIGLVAFGSIRYFPRPPAFNICNDHLAWSSLIDSVTARKVEADIQILASISNPNHFDVVLDMGKGTFLHGDDFLGTLDIPPTTVAAMAITDVLIVASFTPERWEAFSIAKEFRQGTLVLHLALEMELRVPALLNYEFTVSIKDHEIRMSDDAGAAADRSLCACPTWSDSQNNNSNTLQLTVPNWMMQHED